MGLDSVELVLEIERFFCLTLSDTEVSKVFTVQDVVDLVAKQLSITLHESDLCQEVSERLLNCFFPHSGSQPSHNDNIPVSTVLDYTDKERWQQLEHCVGLTLPRPYPVKSRSFTAKPLSWFYGKQGYNWNEIDLVRFAECVCAVNYERLLTPQAIFNTLEIYFAIAGILTRKLGIDVFEISPEKAFVNDLGID